jgi:hypothetical protein
VGVVCTSALPSVTDSTREVALAIAAAGATILWVGLVTRRVDTASLAAHESRFAERTLSTAADARNARLLRTTGRAVSTAAGPRDTRLSGGTGGGTGSAVSRIAGCVDAVAAAIGESDIAGTAPLHTAAITQDKFLVAKAHRATAHASRADTAAITAVVGVINEVGTVRIETESRLKYWAAAYRVLARTAVYAASAAVAAVEGVAGRVGALATTIGQPIAADTRSLDAGAVRTGLIAATAVIRVGLEINAADVGAERLPR